MSIPNHNRRQQRPPDAALGRACPLTAHHVKNPADDPKLTAFMKRTFPTWDPQELRTTLNFIRSMADPAQVIPGVLDSACAFFPGACVIELHFDGRGGVEIDPESTCSPAMLDLARALRLLLGEKLTVGKPGVAK